MYTLLDYAGLDYPGLDYTWSEYPGLDRSGLFHTGLDRSFRAAYFFVYYYTNPNLLRASYNNPSKGIKSATFGGVSWAATRQLEDNTAVFLEKPI